MPCKKFWQNFFAKSNQILPNQLQLDHKIEPDMTNKANNVNTTPNQSTKKIDGLKLPKKRKFRTFAEFFRLPSTYEKNYNLINLNSDQKMSNLKVDDYMIDITGLVYYMRGYRMGMVQTEVF